MKGRILTLCALVGLLCSGSAVFAYEFGLSMPREWSYFGVASDIGCMGYVSQPVGGYVVGYTVALQLVHKDTGVIQDSFNATTNSVGMWDDEFDIGLWWKSGQSNIKIYDNGGTQVTIKHMGTDMNFVPIMIQ